MHNTQDCTNTRLFQQIVDHCYGNIFVTDGQGRIIYVNESSAESLAVPRERLLQMTAQELVEQGFCERAMSLEAIRTRKTAFGLVPCLKSKINLAVVSNVVLDKLGRVEMTVTYSQTESKLNDFVSRLESNCRKMSQAVKYLGSGKLQSTLVVTESAASRRVFEYAEQVANSDLPVLINGESGTGKDVLSRYIHMHSQRSEQPFIPVNCAAIPQTLMESEFFGYESGAFTGAQKGGRAGYFEMSDHGTLFLDEVSELPLVLQSKLLRVLESGEFMRLGGHVAHKVDVRIISATNRDLREMVEMGKFRQDLFYRLNVIPITMPPLRERPEDILALADLYLQQCNRKFGLNQYFSQETRALFLNYDWPGNVRELKNVVQRLAVTIKQDELLLDRDTFFRPIVVPLKDTEGDKGIAETALPWKAYMERAEVEYFRQMLLHCKGNVSCAAKEMGLHRSALYKKIRKYGLTGFAQREE